ncbi:MAG: 4,5-DOPA dioxygenase extradiol [Candidatus Kapabacteria bacterium]|nr:4,5-DOPA dioxygenase extradiol [Candidatus Kapabacteria bacterium]
MNRRQVLAMLPASVAIGAKQPLSSLAQVLGMTTPRMPVLFVGHGNPMNAITDNSFSREWAHIGSGIRPRAILCVSAHWETHGSHVTSMAKPKTIHDFGGFPDELFRMQYPAPGSPELADTIVRTTYEAITHDHEWGLDHGAWSVLARMFPTADVPVLQLSLDVTKSPLQHIELARQLSFLRTQGVLIIGSGNIVHNLGKVQWRGGSLDWAQEFDATSKKLIEQRDFAALTDYASLGSAARLSVPTPEHYLPMLYALALVDKQEDIVFFNETIDLGSVSMRSFITRS